jgi:hypothetical protein
MGNFYRRSKWNHAAASHAAVAVQGVVYDPTGTPDQRLVTARANLRPAYAPLKSVPADADYIVLDVPFGKRGSNEIRQWAKAIGARWQMSHKEWRITASRVDADRLRIINGLRLYLNHTTKAAPAFLARIGNDQCLVFLSVPFEDKDTVKADGARWDTATRRWYFPMKRNLGLAAFGQKIAKYEAKGWVDIAATELHNAPCLGMTIAGLAALREPNEQTAAQKAFVISSAAVATSTNTGFSTHPFLVHEKAWLTDISSLQALNSECANQWLLRKQHSDGREAWIRVQRIDGWKILRMSYRSIGDRTWTHEYCDADTARRTWEDAVKTSGYTMYSQFRLTGAQMFVLVGTGTWTNAPTSAEIAMAQAALIGWMVDGGVRVGHHLP